MKLSSLSLLLPKFETKRKNSAFERTPSGEAHSLSSQHYPHHCFLYVIFPRLSNIQNCYYYTEKENPSKKQKKFWEKLRINQNLWYKFLKQKNWEKKYFIKFLEKFLRKNSRRTLVDEQKNCRKHLTRKKIRDFLKREIHEEKLRKWKSNLEWKKFPPRSQEKVIFEKIWKKF